MEFRYFKVSEATPLTMVKKENKQSKAIYMNTLKQGKGAIRDKIVIWNIATFICFINIIYIILWVINVLK